MRSESFGGLSAPIGGDERELGSDHTGAIRIVPGVDGDATLELGVGDYAFGTLDEVQCLDLAPISLRVYGPDRSLRRGVADYRDAGEAEQGSRRSTREAHRMSVPPLSSMRSRRT